MNFKLLPAAFSIVLLCATSRAAEKPNVLFIAIDDLKPLLGCYGDKLVKSPNIDRLAARGVRFERAYCNQAVCAPSRNSLMTSLRPQTLGIYDLGTNFRKSRPDAITLPQAFQRAGYRTEAMGKIYHVGHGNDDDAASWTVPLYREKTIGYASPENLKTVSREEALFANQPVSKDMSHGAPTEAADVPDEGYPDGRIATEAIRRLKAAAAKPGEPFFMAVGFLKPHLPFCAPKKYWDMYDRASFVVPERRTPPDGAPAFAPTTWGELRQYSDIPAAGPVGDDQARKLIHGYHAATTYMDAQLGRVLDALDASGLSDKTIIVLWGDHGWHLGDHGMWCKHSNYEQATHIPLIVAAPGVKPANNSHLVETVDIYPTLCELASVEAPAGLDGKSFAASVRDPSAPAREFITHVYPRGERLGRAIRDSRYRMVEWKKPGAPAGDAIIELYDYEADPGETVNVAARQPDVVAKMRAQLAQQAEARPQISAAAQPKSDRAALFASKDQDHDGQLTREEFLAKQPDPDKAPARFLQFDADKNGVLSRDEFIISGKVPAAQKN